MDQLLVNKPLMQGEATGRRISGWVPLIILFVVLMFRLETAPGMAQGDDLAYSELAWRFSQGEFSHYYTIFYFRWLVFVPVALLYRLFGVSDFTTLIWPIGLSVLNVWLVYHIVREEANDRVGLLAAALYGFFPLISVYGTFLQVATTLESATLLGIRSIQVASRRESLAWTVFSGCLGGLTLLGRETGGFVFFFMGVYLIRIRGFRRQTMGRILLLALAGGIPLLIQTACVWKFLGDPLARVKVSKWAVEIQNKTEGMDPKELWFYPKTMVLRGGFYDRDYFAWFGFILPVVILGIIVVRPRGWRIFLSWLLVYWGFMSFAPSSLSPYKPLIRNIRYMIVLIWPMCAMVALLIDSALSQRRHFSGSSLRKGIALLGGLAFLGIFLSNAHFAFVIQDRFTRGHAPFRKMARFVNTLTGPVFVGDMDMPGLLRYYGGFGPDRFRNITNLMGINATGTMIVIQGAHPDRYLLPLEQVAMVVKKPPASWEKLMEIPAAMVFRVQPTSAQDLATMLRAEVPLPQNEEVDLHARQVLPIGGAQVLQQDMRGFQGSWMLGDQVFVGTDEVGQGARLVLCPPRDSGSLQVALSTAPDFGTVDLLWDGRVVVSGIDLFSETVDRRLVFTPSLDFSSGRGELAIHVAGKNEKSGGFKFGLDSLKIPRANQGSAQK